MPMSLNQQIEEVERELDLRRRTYPMLYAKGSMRPSVGEYHIERLRAVLETLRWLRDNELLIKQRMTG